MMNGTADGGTPSLAKGVGVMNINDELHTLRASLTTLHLGHAIDEYKRAKKLAAVAYDGFEKSAKDRYAVSSIVHGFCGLESMVNELFEEMFFDTTSAFYVSPENRNPLLRSFLNNWKSKNTQEKLSVLLYQADIQISSQTETKFRELNILRNWLVHGFGYEITILIEQISETEYEKEFRVWDREDSVNWKEKFPNTKFNSLDKLNYQDAKTALEIIFDILKALTNRFKKVLTIVVCEDPHFIEILLPEMFDHSKLLE